MTEAEATHKTAQKIPEVTIYNTMSRRKERFLPLTPGEIKMYACGPTVYNYFHLGNARMFVTFDLFRRFMEFIGYKVTFVQNFTDIDDKVIKRANEEGIGIQELTERYIEAYFYDADRLGVRRATAHPKATETINEIIAMIQILVDKGYCYAAEDGVYYETRKFKDYGKLSHIPLEDLIVDGGRREMRHEQKRHPEDFAVWKFAKPGEPAWDSPWGAGRPGWHIECSAMSRKYLGASIDIHCGGSDLIFPHHENEIAQSEAANGCVFARYWMHNGFINVDDVKMSKSKGNFFTVRELARKHSYEVLRFFMLTGHYRSPINFSDELLAAAGKGLERIKTCAFNLDFLLNAAAEPETAPESADQKEARMSALSLSEFLAPAKARFIAAMADDLNTPDALAVIFDLVRESNLAMAAGFRDKVLLGEAVAEIRELMRVLGFELVKKEEVSPEVLALVEARTAAKKAKNYAEADKLRMKVTELGYKIDDTPEGAKVSKL